MDYPLVTVFTLIYNTNPIYVIEAIESIRANNYPNLQHIIVDDCSPDIKPKEVVKEWIKENNYSCEFYEHEVNYGICKTLNHVLSLAKGEYIFGCSDDLIAENYIQMIVKAFSKLGSDYALVFGLCQLIGEKSEKKPFIYPQLTIPENENYLDLLMTSNCIPAIGTTYRTETLRNVGGFNENVKFEDWDIFLRFASLEYKFKCMPEIVSFYRIHSQSISNMLNFRLEYINILLSFKNLPKVKEAIYGRVWDMCYNKERDYQEALKLYEQAFSIDWKLKLIAFLTNKFFIRFVNKLLKFRILNSK